MLGSPRNKFELKIFNQLLLAGTDFKYESDKISYVLAKKYIPDFILDTPLGKVYIECKGYLRPEHKAKLLAVKKQHPEIDLRILFYRDKYKSDKSSIKWAKKNNFIYAVSEIPEEWYYGRW